MQLCAFVEDLAAERAGCTVGKSGLSMAQWSACQAAKQCVRSALALGRSLLLLAMPVRACP